MDTRKVRAAKAELQNGRRSRDDAIQEARRRLKKVHAILQLVDADNGRGVTDSNKRIGRVNDTLSRLRDATAMLEVPDKLKTQSANVLDEHTFARIRRRLSSKRRDAITSGRFTPLLLRDYRPSRLRQLRLIEKAWSAKNHV
jgi:hypothetical protein